MSSNWLFVIKEKKVFSSSERITKQKPENIFFHFHFTNIPTKSNHAHLSNLQILYPCALLGAVAPKDGANELYLKRLLVLEYFLQLNSSDK